MPLPGVSIELDNGSIGGVPVSNDGTAGLIITGSSVAGKITVDIPVVVFGVEDAKTKGIEEGVTNRYAAVHVKQFYDNAPAGTPLWIMVVASTVTMESMLDRTKAYAPVLLNAAKGDIRILGVSRESGSGITLASAIDADVEKALIKGQVLADEFAGNFKPFRFIVDGKDFNGTPGSLKNFSITAYNRGSILLGSITLGSKNAAVGFTLGYLANIPVQRKLSRVKNGALPISQAYFTDAKETETKEVFWDLIHDAKYIFFRTFVGKSGYYFSSDPTATSRTDDYSTISRGRVIDKAIRIAYDVYVEEIDEEVEVGADGKINIALIKDLQGKVENRIGLQMLANGEATSVRAVIDPDQNILATNKLEIGIKIIPVGYSSEIEVLLGFENPANQ